MTGNTQIFMKTGIASVAALVLLCASAIAGPPGVVICLPFESFGF